MPSEAPCSPRVSTPAGSGGGQSPAGSPSHSRRRIGVVRHRYRHDVTTTPTGQRAAAATTRLKGSLPPIQTCLPLSPPDTRTPPALGAGSPGYVQAVLTSRLHSLGLRSWQLQLASLIGVAMCIMLWLRAKTLDQDERGNAERRALFAGLWPPTLW